MTTTDQWLEKHRPMLDAALARVHDRAHYGAFAESPSERVHGEGAKDNGKRAFESALNRGFDIPGHPGETDAGEEFSPYGFSLGVKYPRATDISELVARAKTAGDSWRRESPDGRAGAAVEILSRLQARCFETAHAVMHTTGQGFLMAFQAGAAHALDRGLEAAALSREALCAVPRRMVWEKPQGKRPPLRLEKTFTPVPRGAGAVICCATFPTWNGYPAIFANLVCGAPTIVKPHPETVLPLALAVRTAREVLAECGANPDAVLLAMDSGGSRAAASLARDERVRLIDFTGGSEFGEWLENNAPHARVFAEKSGVNCVAVCDFADAKGMARNLALSAALYSGQMCTAPQNVFVPKARFGEVAEALTSALTSLLSDDARAAEILGAIRSAETAEKLESVGARKSGVLLKPRKASHPEFPDARIRTPAVLRLTTDDRDFYQREHFGPFLFLIEVEDADAGLREMRECMQKRGSLTAAVYADDADFQRRAADIAEETGTQLAINMTGDALLNHSAAFSDFHGSGANRAASACLVDANFVAPRFYFAQSRRPLPAES